MNIEDIRLRDAPKVKTVEVLRASISGTLPPFFTSNRKANTTGTLINGITGHKGELFFVEHDDKTCAAYHHTEFNLHGQTS